MSAIERPDPAEFYDATLRFQVPSGSDPHVNYMVELDSYSGNGECDCPNFVYPTKGFEFSKRDLCAKQVTPEEALSQKLIPPPKSGRISDALRCKHIVEARDELASSVIRALVKAEKLNRK